MTDMQPTIDAVTLLEHTYAELLAADVPSAVRRIILRAQAYLEKSLTQHLTGH